VAKYLVTGFTPEAYGSMSANGVLTMPNAGCSIFAVRDIHFDPVSDIPARQQIESVFVDAVNKQLADYGHAAITLTQADIEYLI